MTKTTIPTEAFDRAAAELEKPAQVVEPLLALAQRVDAATTAAVLRSALDRFTEDVYVSEVGSSFNCGELDALATILASLGKVDAAAWWVLAHSHEDEGEVGSDDASDYDGHLVIRDADVPGIGSEAGKAAALAYVRTELLGLPA